MANPFLQIIDSARKAGIKGYHGSPHDFNEFKTSAIGTGEGAQQYGRGFYFGEAEKVAKRYRDQLTPRDLDYEDWLTEKYKAAESNQDYARMEMYERAMLNETPQDFKDLAADVDYDEDYRALAAEVGEEIEEYGPDLGHMYEVNIDADPDELIDWDELIDEQPKKIMDKLKKADWWEYAEEGIYESAGIRGDNPTGADLVRWLERDGQEYAAEALEDLGVKGIKYADAFTRHKPKDKRSSNYVIFDPRIIEISKKYGISIPLASAVAAGGMTPEEAQAGGIKSVANEGIRSLGETLEFDPRFDPRIREKEGLQSLRVDVLPRNESMVKPPIRLSELEGEDFVTSMADRTRAGGMIMGVNDVPLYRAVDLRGGQDFMFENPNQVWASAKVPSEKILEMARELQGQSGKDPIFIPWRMAPTGGDFSNMVGELMLGFASSNMNKTTKKAFDVAVRKYRTKGSIDKGVRKNAGLKIKEWPGVDDPRAVEIWRSTPDAVRKELMNMMDVNFRKEGGLSIGAARLAASDPTQLMSRDAGLQNVGRIYTGRDIAPSTHPSYPYAVPGEGIGALKGADEVTIFDLLPDARFGDAQKKVKDPANPTAREVRALQMKPYGGTITENILRRIEERGVDVNSLVGISPGALAFTLTSAGLLTPEEAAAGGLDEVAEVFSSTKDGMGVKSKKPKEQIAFKAASPEIKSPGLPSLAGQLGLGAMSEIGGVLAGGAAGVGEYLRGGLSGPEYVYPFNEPATAESIRDAREGTSEFVGGLYDAGPEAQEFGQEIMRGIGEEIAPIAEYAMKGPIMDERGLNMLPLIAQKLGIPAYQLAEMLFNKLPEREQEAAISASDVFL